MPRFKRRSHLRNIREINMTPLIDLTFILLIVFMITVPMMEYSIDVSPPEMDAATKPESNNVTVSLDNEGKIHFKEKVVSLSTLKNEVKKLISSTPETIIFLKADGERSYNEVIDMMKTMKDAGAEEISLITQAEPERK